MRQTQRHGADLSGRKPGDQPLHLRPDAPHELGHSGTMHAAQVQLVLENDNPVVAYQVNCAKSAKKCFYK